MAITTLHTSGIDIFPTTSSKIAYIITRIQHPTVSNWYKIETTKKIIKAIIIFELIRRRLASYFRTT